jgi:S-formylglutathione hydrolase FrmB
VAENSKKQIILPLLEPKLYDQRALPIVIDSRVLGIPKCFYVYTPPCYLSFHERLPVLYLFRGHEREWVNPEEEPARLRRTVIDVYEQLLLEGAVGPMIMVFPGISSDDNKISGLLVNFKEPPVPTVPGIGTGQFEDYFLHELVPYIEEHYRTQPGARAVDGFSLGGFMATKIATQYPHLFRSVGAFDGLYFWDDSKDAYSIDGNDLVFLKPLFDPAFGFERDHRYAAANNPPNLIRTTDPSVLGQLTWVIEYGPQSGEPDRSNFYRGDHLCNLLAAKGITNRGRGEIPASTHSWYWADEHMQYALPLHWQALI